MLAKATSNVAWLSAPRQRGVASGIVEKRLSNPEIVLKIKRARKEGAQGHLHRYDTSAEYRHNQEADGIPRILFWSDGTRAENDDGSDTRATQQQKGKPAAAGSSKGKGKSKVKAAAAAVVAAAAPSGADAAKVIGVAASRCTHNELRHQLYRDYSMKVGIEIGLEPETVILVIIAVAFCAGAFAMYIGTKLYRWWRRDTITEAWTTPSGERIHCDEACAQRLARGKIIKKRFCLHCTPYGLK